MIYLSHIDFPGFQVEEQFLSGIAETCFNTAYPFGMLSVHDFRMIDFDTITILHGSNGSGKTTALNVIAELVLAERDTLYNRSSFFGDYLRMSTARFSDIGKPETVRIITSDDVFEFMLNLRALNEGIDVKREDLFDEYYAAKRKKGFRMGSLDDYDELKRINAARSKSKSKYVKDKLGKNLREQSNGESALMYFTEKISGAGLYLLDEPENSLSPERQLELKEFIEDAARMDECQIVMATHSPFLLSMRGAKIYDLDADPVDVKRWTELPNVRAYKEFFDSHAEDF